MISFIQLTDTFLGFTTSHKKQSLQKTDLMTYKNLRQSFNGNWQYTKNRRFKSTYGNDDVP